MRGSRSRSFYAGLGFLVLLSLSAALPGNPAGPLDARTYERVEGLRLEMPGGGAVIEPFSSLSHALAGAPDHRKAVFSALIWCALLGGLWAFLGERRRHKREPLPWNRLAWKVPASAFGAVLLFAAYILFGLLVRVPGWRLASDSPDLLIADLHTHTFGSHDGLVPAEYSLEVLKSRGIEVAAVTEHALTDGSERARRVSEADASLPAVIPGVEIREQGGGYMLGLGVHVPRGARDAKGLRDPKTFAAYCRGEGAVYPGGGAILALSWKLDPSGIERLADAGFDGFEIVNFGHPAAPAPVRDAMLRMRKERGLALVSDSDWHGWGGFWRTWTVFRIAGAAGMGREERAQAVVRDLRERSVRNIIPVVAGRMGVPPLWRVVLAPFWEFARYTRELDAARVVSWWLWAAFLGALGMSLKRQGWRPERVMLSGFIALLGFGLSSHGWRMISAWASGQTATSFPGEIGGWALGVGVAALLTAGTLFHLERMRRG